MKRSKGMQLGAMLVAMLLVSMALMPAVSAQRANEQKTTGVVYTPAELKDLYSKYNITENDIKFAENKLPNFREGTILDGNTKVIITETGEPPEELKEGVDYDKVISIEEGIAIEEEARERYIQKYAVDPANPKIDIINGQPLPTEEVKKLVKSGKIDLKDKTGAEPLVSILSGTTEGPHAINGIVDVHIFVATDSAHKPTELILSDTNAALNRFETTFGVTLQRDWHFSWDASDVSPATDAYQAVYDLRDDTAWVRTEENDIVLGWAHDLDLNGVAEYRDAFVALASDTRVGSVDWPHDSIVQHEVSHLFDAPERGTWSWEHQECIMNYEWAYWGTNIWCPTDSSTVNANIHGS